ncbi:MAG: IS30 family transposase [Saprospiraceae bacterium]|nr:IS30 family transposase [Saprospiraceae bacterium]
MYKQITYPQRVLIEQFRRQGMSIIQIALELGFHRSTIYRELDRNSSPGSYKLYGSARAQDRSEQRAQGKGRKNKITSDLRCKVDQLLKIKWSPEQIEGRANIDKYERVSKECIYQYVYEDKRKGGDLWSNLRHSHRRRRRRKNTYKQRELSKTEYVLKIDQRLLNLKKVWRLGRRYYSRKES